MQNQPLHIDEDSRLSLSLKLIKGTLIAVSVGAFWAAGVFFLALSIKDDMRDVKRTMMDHERRIMKIEAKTGIAKVSENGDGWGD
jgi:hypothetical protein